MARAWAILMTRLGYERYVAQGGDWGNAVTEQMALQRPAGLIGIHTNMPATLPAEVEKAWPNGPSRRASRPSTVPGPAGFYKHGLGYAGEMANRPQTLYALADSPVGLAAWMLDHDDRSRALIARVFDGAVEGLTRDDILDNVTLYWVTNTAVSSARLYWESKLDFFAPKGVPLPTAVSAYPDDLYGAAKLDREGLSQADPLQSPAQGWAFRSLGTAAVLHRRASRELPQPALSSPLRGGRRTARAPQAIMTCGRAMSGSRTGALSTTRGVIPPGPPTRPWRR